MRDTSRADLIHRVPAPRSVPDPKREPFVGNETVDDNLVELAQLAIWNVIGRPGQDIAVGAKSGVVTLSGQMKHWADIESIVGAVREIEGVGDVVCEITLPSPSTNELAREPRLEHVASEPFLYLVRYCGLEEASMSAAIAGAVERLDQCLTARQVPLTDRLLIIYRNMGADSVTLEIGMPVSEPTMMMGDGLKAGSTPGGATLSIQVAAGSASLLAAMAQLRRSATAAGMAPDTLWWQSFAADQFRPWRGHPAGALHLPIRTRGTPEPARQAQARPT